MNELESQSKLPLRMTYRAVGSTTCQREFIHNNDPVESMAHFGRGDLPITSERFQGMTDAGIAMVHLPVLIGAVSFFHNVPGASRLNMTGEVLAAIYNWENTDWK